MKRYMLDTNTVSHLIREHPMVVERVISNPMTAICISVITEGELLFGLARRPEAKRLHLIVKEFLKRVDVLPWDSTLSEHYGQLRAKMELQGKILAPLDLLIATHALDKNIILISDDQAFRHVPNLHLENWTQ